MKRCLECGTELNGASEIIFHSCEAYPKREEFSWLDVLMKDKKEEGE